MRLTDEREQFIRETGGGFADIAVLLGEVDALRAELSGAIASRSRLGEALARAEAAETEAAKWMNACAVQESQRRAAEAHIATVRKMCEHSIESSDARVAVSWARATLAQEVLELALVERSWSGAPTLFDWQAEGVA